MPKSMQMAAIAPYYDNRLEKTLIAENVAVYGKTSITTVRA